MKNTRRLSFDWLVNIIFRSNFNLNKLYKVVYDFMDHVLGLIA